MFGSRAIALNQARRRYPRTIVAASLLSALLCEILNIDLFNLLNTAHCSQIYYSANFFTASVSSQFSSQLLFLT